MPQPYLTFQQFNDTDVAIAVARQLQDQGIDCIVEKDAPLLGTVFVGGNFESTTYVKLSPDDFPRAYAALEIYYQAQLETLPADYYLYSFTDTELMEIIQRPDEWGHLDHVLAKKLLAERGQEITPALAGEFQQQRLAELAKPETTHPFQIMWGYAAVIAFGLFSPMMGHITSFICGSTGLTLGYVLAYLKKTLPNGQWIHVYPPEEQKHGKRILVIGGISFVAWLVLTLHNHGMFPFIGPF
jgi:hypothetical protein